MSTQVLPTPPYGGGGGGGGTPASTVVTEQAFGQASAVGTSTDYARADHTHGTPTGIAPSVITTAASPYLMTASITTVFANPGAAQTVRLPSAGAVVAGAPYTVKRYNTSANVVTVTSLSGTIDGVAAGTGIALAAGTLDSITVQSDGTNWWIV
jgi:hypothetical protein